MVNRLQVRLGRLAKVNQLQVHLGRLAKVNQLQVRLRGVALGLATWMVERSSPLC